MKVLTELGGFYVLLWPLSFWVVFLIGAVVLVVVASWAGRRLGRRGWGRWALLAVVVYVLWDAVPVLWRFHHLCSAEAGFRVLESLESWKARHPAVWETLEPVDDTPWDTQGDTTRVALNQRFVWEMRRRKCALGIWERRERIVDAVTGEVLAEYVDFATLDSRGKPWPRNWLNPREIKFWLGFGSCEADGNKVNRGRFYEFESVIEKVG